MSDESPVKVQTVLCIPGPWKNRSELVTSVVGANQGKFLLAGNLLFRPEVNEGYEVDVRNADLRMWRAFAAAGPHWLNTPEMIGIKDHRMVVYILGEGGSPQRADRLMQAAIGLLNAGGLGVKVESTGIAHSPNAWRDFAKKSFLKSLHTAYVIYLTGDECISCGMHNLGLKDVIVEAADAEDPVKLLQTFTQYMFLEKPVLEEGHTFSVEADAPRYRMTPEACAQHEAGSLFINPFGMWRLRLV